MNVALAVAARVQTLIDCRTAAKARPPAEIHAEAQLHKRMAATLEQLLATVGAAVDDRGLPGDTGAAALLLGDTTDLAEQLLDVLVDEVGDEAARAIAHVEAVVAGARKANVDDLRPYGMDRRLFDTMTGLRDRMLTRMTSRTVDALVDAADVALPPDQLRDVLAEMLDGELAQLSRHALGDARNEATEVAERDLGVTHHRWVTAGDDQVRPAHADVDGEVAAVGEPFSNGWRRPGGVGCRCRLEPVVETTSERGVAA